jgi:putative transposase
VSRGTIANVLKRNGIEPSPERAKRAPLVDLLEGALESAVCRGLSDGWSVDGKGAGHLLPAIRDESGQSVRGSRWHHHPTRRGLDGSSGTQPYGLESGMLRAKQYLIIDRDSKYMDQFRRLIGDSGTKVIRLPPRSPNLNAYCERFVRSIKDECWSDWSSLVRHRCGAPLANTLNTITASAITKGLAIDYSCCPG